MVPKPGIRKGAKAKRRASPTSISNGRPSTDPRQAQPQRNLRLTSNFFKEEGRYFAKWLRGALGAVDDWLVEEMAAAEEYKENTRRMVTCARWTLSAQQEINSQALQLRWRQKVVSRGQRKRFTITIGRRHFFIRRQSQAAHSRTLLRLVAYCNSPEVADTDILW